MMTRKNFETLAGIISRMNNNNWTEKCNVFNGVVALCKENPRFDEYKFAEACGMNSYYDAVYTNLTK